jgi:hypothetical protein
MSSQARIAIALVAGFVVGAVAVAAFFTLIPRKKSHYYVVTTDADLETTYFFRSDTVPPLKGILRKGSTFEVEGRHSIADYVVLRTVIDHSQVQRFAREISPPKSQSIVERQKNYHHPLKK